MATRKLLKPIQEQIDGSFLDVHVPQFEWIKINLIHTKTKWVNNKINEVERTDDNFNISISLSEKLNSEDRGLSLKIKDICKLNFPPYYWREKAYRFYTSDRTGSLEEKKEILTELLSLLKNYEVEKKAQFKESNEVFDNDAKNKIKLETSDLLMKFHEPTQRFVVLAKDFLGPEKYALLRKSSEYTSQLSTSDILLKNNVNQYLLTIDFFTEDLPNKKLEKKTYFFIHPSFYESVKNHFESEAKSQYEFLEKQKKVSAENDLSQYNIESENVFGLKIKFVEESQCFEFYGRGYFDTQGYNGRHTPRSLIGTWALNFIYAEEPKEDNLTSQYDMYLDKNKIELQEVKGGSKKEKNVHIPASEWPKIKQIKENFENENKLWGRDEKTIKITHCDFSEIGIFDRFPAVYFDNKGNCFLGFGSRRTGSFKAIGQSAVSNDFSLDIPEDTTQKIKKPRQSKFSISLKAIPISFNEAKYFMHEHPFADHIYRGSLELNARIHGPTDQILMTQEEKQSVFQTVLLHAEIQSQTKIDESSRPKTRKLKI